MSRSSATIRRTKKLTRKLPGPCTTWSKQCLSAVHPVTCILHALSEVPVWPTCNFTFWGQMTPKVKKNSKMSFRIRRRNTELPFVATFGENRPLRSCRKFRLDYHTKNSGYTGLVPAPPPILPKMSWSRPKFPERCHPLTCPRIPNLVWIGWALPDWFQKRLIFRTPKVSTGRL